MTIVEVMPQFTASNNVLNRSIIFIHARCL